MYVPLNILGPAVRGFILKRGKRPTTRFTSKAPCHFDWTYKRDQTELARLYEIAKRGQWNVSSAFDWSQRVDPDDPDIDLVPEEDTALPEVPAYRKLPEKTKRRHRYHLMAWMLSQFLHGEQGALAAACQATEAIQTLDGKLFGSTQVVDEGRHVEVFTRYLTEKLEKMYVINDNLYTIIDALMTDSRWDMKFLGMQIMIEGLALGAFGTLRKTTQEPLLKEILRRVIIDEGRHVTYGVVTLREYYPTLTERQRRERESWAYEIAIMLRNRFLAHEFFEEFYAQSMSKTEWNRIVLGSNYMKRFRKMMFKRLIPNLKEIGLLSDRIRPHYEAMGLLQWENEKSAMELTTAEMLGESA